MIHPLDLTLEPIRKAWFKLQKNQSERWYAETRDYAETDCNTYEYLSNRIQSGEPLMVTRLGTSELHIILNYLSRQVNFFPRIKKYITGQLPEFWWGRYALNDIAQNSGFFPSSNESLEEFAKLYLSELPNVDVLFSWLKGERLLDSYLSNVQKKLFLFGIEPYFFSNPWTKALEYKKVLVIHPFEDSVQTQYKKRHSLFKDPDVLPEFQLITLKAIQSIKGNSTKFNSWFEALEHMKEQVKKINFDIALIAAGAYGLPLAAYAKHLGKQGLHLGGSLQILFGIRGKRWEESKFHKHLINEHWKFPYEHEYPINYKKLDRGSYW